MTEPSIPRLFAYPRRDGTGLRVWCAWCQVWHVHGTPYGHRVAHCHVRSSPYRATGYILIPPDDAADPA
jgi:hypothetical protein